MRRRAGIDVGTCQLPAPAADSVKEWRPTIDTGKRGSSAWHQSCTTWSVN